MSEVKVKPGGVRAFLETVMRLIEADAPHFDLTGDVLRQHLIDAHYKDRALIVDATDETMASSHISAHNAAESKAPEPVVAEETVFQEKAIGKDGTMRIKLIAPGWGSSGYYSEQMLQRDGPLAFPKGTKMYADHPTVNDEKDRPERSIKDIAAVTESDAAWENDKAGGPGLYAKAKVIDTWKPQIEALSSHIGTSIRALGMGKPGEAEGRKGVIVERLTQGKSVDFVTEAGAGGKVMSLAESARSRATEENGMADEKELTEARTKLAEAEKRATDSDTARRRAEEKLLLREATEHVTTLVAKAKLPDITKKRIVETASSNPPVDKDGALDRKALEETVAKVVKDEAAYLAGITGSGKVRDLGGKVEPSEADVTAQLTEAFKAMGHSEAEAKLMAGRN